MYKIKCDSCNALAINGHAAHETGCHGAMTYIRETDKREFRRATVWSLDVWGNPHDGFEVNDRSKIGNVFLPADLSDKSIIQCLKRAEVLRKRMHLKSFRIDGDDCAVTINLTRTGKPILTLEMD